MYASLKYNPITNRIEGLSTLNFVGQLNVDGDVSLTSGNHLMFFGPSNTDWRMGYALGAYDASIVLNGIEISIGGDTFDGLSIGLSGGTSILELSGNTSDIFIKNGLYFISDSDTGFKSNGGDSASLMANGMEVISYQHFEGINYAYVYGSLTAGNGTFNIHPSIGSITITSPESSGATQPIYIENGLENLVLSVNDIGDLQIFGGFSLGNGSLIFNADGGAKHSGATVEGGGINGVSLGTRDGKATIVLEDASGARCGIRNEGDGSLYFGYYTSWGAWVPTAFVTGALWGTYVPYLSTGGYITLDGTLLHMGSGSRLEFEESGSAPAAVANKVVLWAQDNGSGKTQLMARFGTGSAVEIAIEP